MISLSVIRRFYPSINEHRIVKAHLLAKDLIAANAITLITAVIGGIYPAWKASRLKPVDAIAHT